MANKNIPIEFGGLNLDAQPGSFNGQAIKAQNIRYLPEGGISCFGGEALDGSHVTTSTRYPLYSWGTKNYIVYLNTVTTPASINLSWFAVATPGTIHDLTGWATANPFFSVLNGKLLITPPEQSNISPVYWDGSAAAVTAIATAPKASYPAVHYDRVFLGNCYNDPNIVYWSDLYDASTWTTATSFIYVGKDDGDKIVGLHSFNGDLYIFKRFSVWKLVGNVFSATGNYTLYKTALPGCVNHESICDANGVMYWFSYDGFVAFNGSGIEKIGSGIIDKTYTLPAVTASITNFITIPITVYNEIWFLCKLDRGVSSLVYNYGLKKWSTTSISCSGATLVDLTALYGNGLVKIMYCPIYQTSPNIGDLWYADFSVALGVDSGIYITDWLDLGDNWSTKNYFNLLLKGTHKATVYGNDVSIGYAFDYGSYSTDENVVFPTNKYKRFDIKSIPAKTMSLSFTFTANETISFLNKASILADITDDGRLYK